METKIEIKNKVFPFIWMFLKKNKLLFLITAVFCSLNETLSVVVGQYFLKIVIDNLSSGSTNINKIILNMFLFVFFTYAEILASIVILKSYFNLEKNIQSNIRNTLFQYLMNHNMRFFNDNFIGSVGSKINDVADGSMNIIANGLNVFAYMTLFISVLIIFEFENFYLFLIMLFLIAIYAVFFTFLAKKMKESYKNCCMKKNILFGNVIDCFNSILLVKSFSNERYEKYKNKKFLLQTFICGSRVYYFRGWLKFLNFIIFFLMLFSTSLFGLYLFLKGQITLGTLNLLIISSGKLIGRIRYLFDGATRCFEEYGEVEQGLESLIRKNEIINFSDKKLIVKNGEISIKNIYFKYKGGESYVFNDFSLDVPAHQKIGIVGYSGAGKSTLINLLLRFYDVEKGSISIDGENIKTDISQESLHKNISYISQDPILFNRTIKENILYGDLKATNEELIEATKKANCYDFINNLQDGFDSLVGEKGVKLSGGQKQRISIARAILKKSKILILDEATSALDSITEYKVQTALDNLMRNKTVIAIAHRLSTLHIMDRIIVIDKGKIVEDGTREELLKNKDGLFSSMWNLQHNGIIGDED